MERAKKMVLISTENLARMQQQQQQQQQTLGPTVATESEAAVRRNSENEGETVNTPGTVLSRLDADMYRILNSATNENAREKWKLYREVLQRYLYFFREREKQTKRAREEENEEAVDEKTLGEQRKGGDDDDDDNENRTVVEDIFPAESSLATTPNIADAPSRTRQRRLSEQKSIRGVLCGVPKTFRAKARKLLIHLCDVAVPDRISWNREGIVTIDGRLLNGARIGELVNDAVRRRKTAKAAGRAQFARLLREVGTPLEFVGNPDFRHSITRVPKRSFGETSLAEEQEYDDDDGHALYLTGRENRRCTRVSNAATKFSNSKRRMIAPPKSTVADPHRSSSSSSASTEKEFFAGLRKRFPRGCSSPVPPGGTRVAKRGYSSLAKAGENVDERDVFITANENKHRTRVSGNVSKSASKRRLIDWEQMV